MNALRIAEQETLAFQPKVSVIIPTFNGANRINNLLKSLFQQTYKNFEVIIVSDGSTDGVLTVLENWNNKLSITSIYQENKGRAAARNKGAAFAQHQLLLFIDDDMRPLPNCIEEHVNHHVQFPGSILTGGVAEEVNTASNEFLNYKSFLSNKWLAEFKNNQSKK